jgi:hypothetical protein
MLRPSGAVPSPPEAAFHIGSFEKCEPGQKNVTFTDEEI